MIMSTLTDNTTRALTDALQKDFEGKKWYTSKTLWANTIASISLIVQMRYGFVIDASMQALALTLVNVALRVITEKPIVFS